MGCVLIMVIQRMCVSKSAFVRMKLSSAHAYAAEGAGVCWQAECIMGDV